MLTRVRPKSLEFKKKTYGYLFFKKFQAKGLTLSNEMKSSKMLHYEPCVWLSHSSYWQKKKELGIMGFGF
jgi:hypothetical protein